MVKHFDKVWILPEDKRLLKSAASLKGMKIHEYLGQRIRQDAVNTKQELEAVANTFEQKQREVRRFGLFR